MSVALFRVDERLIHGQVVVGWGRKLKFERILVVDDELAEEPAEQELYRTGLPAGIEADFWSVDEAAGRVPDLLETATPVIVLTRSLEAMTRLAAAGVPIAEVNVGGIHGGDERRRVLPYVALDEADERRIRRLEDVGVRVVAQDLPTAPRVRLRREDR